MDDSVAALLCLPFIILPAIVLIAIILNKVRAFATDAYYFVVKAWTYAFLVSLAKTIQTVCV